MDGEADGGGADEGPELVRVADDAVPLPDGLREGLGVEEGEQLLAVVTERGLLLRRLELPTVGEYGEWVERHAAELGVTEDEMADLLHRYIAGEEAEGGKGLEDVTGDASGEEGT